MILYYYYYFLLSYCCGTDWAKGLKTRQKDQLSPSPRHGLWGATRLLPIHFLIKLEVTQRNRWGTKNGNENSMVAFQKIHVNVAMTRQVAIDLSISSDCCILVAAASFERNQLAERRWYGIGNDTLGTGNSSRY